MLDLRRDIGSILVGTRQLRNIGIAGEEAGIRPNVSLTITATMLFGLRLRLL
jgi:hypothetical protein